jgi:hypothetical protein
MAIDPLHVYHTRSREHVRKIQKLVAEARKPTVLPKDIDHADVVPAQLAASAAGVGDNLAEALIDVHTRSNPTARSWVDGLRQDIVNGDGDIEPELAFADVPLNAAASMGKIDNPLDLAESTSQQIGGSPASGVSAHRLIFTGAV